MDLLADVLDGFVRRDSQPWGIYSREFVRKTHDWAHTIEQVVTATKTAHVDAPKTRLMDNLFRVAFRGGMASGVDNLG